MCCATPFANVSSSSPSSPAPVRSCSCSSSCCRYRVISWLSDALAGDDSSWRPAPPFALLLTPVEASAGWSHTCRSLRCLSQRDRRARGGHLPDQKLEDIRVLAQNLPRCIVVAELGL